MEPVLKFYKNKSVRNVGKLKTNNKNSFFDTPPKFVQNYDDSLT